MAELTKKPSASGSDAKYNAPALEKGLDIIELLAGQSKARSLSDISSMLERSNSEIFRMIAVLERRGYIQKDASEGYKLTYKTLELGKKIPATSRLFRAAVPELEFLSETIIQSCHIGIRSRDEYVVLASIESPGDIRISAPVGLRRELEGSTSGHVLLAFQPARVRDVWLQHIADMRSIDDKAIRRKLARVARDGYGRGKNAFVDRVTDVGVPIFDRNREGAIASLTIPYTRCRHAPELEEALTEQMACAERISERLQNTL